MTGNIRNVKWHSDRIILTTPTVEQSNNVMIQLKEQRQTNKYWGLTLGSSSHESLQIVFTNITHCLVRRLNICNTYLDSNCVSLLSNVLTDNETIEHLYLSSSPLPSPNGLQLITSAVSLNSTLKTLEFHHDDSITDEDLPHICHMLSANRTLKLLRLICRNITKIGEIRNNGQTRFEINGHSI